MYPLPLPFIEKIRQEYPQEADLLLTALLESEPTTAIRYNSAKSAQIKKEGTPLPWCPNAYTLPKRPLFVKDPLWHAGVYYVQDAASMALSRVASLLPQRPLVALDLCAAPGGKSTLLRSLLPEGSFLVANEPIAKRCNILQENLAKWGHPLTIVTQNYPDELEGSTLFDFILVDAPCSGEGLFRKMPEAREEWSLQTVAECAIRQQDIVTTAWKMLRPGGILLYATCTFNREENEGIVQYLIESLGAEPLQIPPPPSEWKWIAASQGVGWHFLPGITTGEGFFFATLKKSENSTEEVHFCQPNKRSKISSTAYSQEMLRWIRPEWKTTGGRFACEGVVSWIPQSLDALYQALSNHKKANIRSAGIPLIEDATKGETPAAALAWNEALDRHFFLKMELSLQDALRYLAGETLTAPSSLPRGIALVSYQGIPIGFVKNVGSRCNNLYPKKYRIKINL